MAKKRIEDIDRNFQAIEIGGKKLKFKKAQEKPFALSGFAWYDREHKSCRLPEAILPKTNDGVKSLAWHTSGGMLRFRTDSTVIAIKAKLLHKNTMKHMPNTGSAGFDLYLGMGKDKKFLKMCAPEVGFDSVEGIIIDNLPKYMREWTINFPLYNGIKELSIGLDPESTIEKPHPFTIEKPLLFYGSSITQGGCASRPGNAYTHMIARWLDANLINLGFSGSGRGEPAVAEAIASLDLSAFIMDYDHNAPTIEHLIATHENFFRIIRKKRPSLPVIFVTRCDYDKTPTECEERASVVRATYENALLSGDKNVYFIHGKTLFGRNDRDACTVDGCHPNDIGFYRMAKHIYPVVKKAVSSSF